MIVIPVFDKGFIKTSSPLRVTSDFGWRMDKAAGAIKFHRGIDIGIPVGTVITSPVNGKVVYNTVQKGYAGLYVTIRYIVAVDLFLDIYFMHLNTVDSSMSVGSTVRKGQRIGTSGGDPKDQPNAGSSRGPHLHFEIRKNGNVSVDPKYWFLSREDLFAVSKNRMLMYGDPNFASFTAEDMKSQTQYVYSPSTDITVPNATEYQKTKQKPKQPTIAKERLAAGVWQITKLLVDSSVQNKQVFDSGISTQTGSLLNFFNKVCQKPLVEFMGDTFGSQYYWIVRRPPFDKENILRLMNSAMLTISPEDILSTQLTWNTENIYSWYRYIPYGDVLGNPVAALFQPAVFFPEFASVWGSRPLAIESNYYNYAMSGRYNNDKEEKEENGNRIVRNAVRDFKYLIESNAYNAFTRRGTIVLQGDRRFKRGMLVMHTSGEIFHVDSVQNEYNVSIGGVQRTTTLNVSRGIYPAYIEGVEINGKKMSYFNIIEFGDQDINKLTAKDWKKYISGWKVNLDTFGFFISRQQVFYENLFYANYK